MSGFKCLFILLLFFLTPPLLKAKDKSKPTVVLLGQWHLLSTQKTLDIKESKNLPQFPNQKAIYLILKDWISKGQLSEVIAEGCEGEIDEKFSLNFNGWDYKKLKSLSHEDSYADVMTSVPLKTEVLFGNSVKTMCGDNSVLIKKHQMIMSDLQGFAGFYFRLKEAKEKSNTRGFLAYQRALEEASKTKIKDPIHYCRNKLHTLLEKEKVVLEKRNEHFLKVISRNHFLKSAVVIGYRHLAGLKKLLEKKGYRVETPDLIQETLPKTDFMSELKSKIQALRE